MSRAVSPAESGRPESGRPESGPSKSGQPDERAVTASGDGLDSLRIILIRTLSIAATVVLVIAAVSGSFDRQEVPIVLGLAAAGSAATFVMTVISREVSSAVRLTFLGAIMAVMLLIAVTIQPPPIGTLTGFAFLAIAVFVAASEPARIALTVVGVAMVLGLTAILMRSTVPPVAASIFATLTLLTVYIVIRFRTIILKTRDQAVRASLTDPLTGLGNRRQMDVGLAILASVADRSDQRLGCLVIDIDHFKAVNDRYGHDVGDQVLRATAQTLAEAVRSGDLIVRLGGEEFAVFALVRNDEELRTMGERLRVAVEVAETTPSVTVSIGATLAVDATGTASLMLSTSDRALYRAKQSGRNAVEVD